MEKLFKSLIMVVVATLALTWSSGIVYAQADTPEGDDPPVVAPDQGCGAEVEVIPDGKMLFYCNVDDYRDNTHYDNTIRRYENYFNRPAGSGQLCRQRIDFDGDIQGGLIELNDPLKFKNSGSSAMWFVLGPDDGDNIGFSVMQGTYNAGAQTVDAGEDGVVSEYDNEFADQKCAVTISRPYTMIQNIILSGNAGDWGSTAINGLCINTHHVYIKNVQIEDFSGVGLLLGPNATEITFLGDDNRVDINNNGIRVMGERWDLARNINIPLLDQAMVQDEDTCNAASGNWFSDGSCSDETYETQEDCEAADEMWTLLENCELPSNSCGASVNYYNNGDSGIGKLGRNLITPVGAFINADQLNITRNSNGVQILGQVVSCDKIIDPDCACTEQTGVHVKKILVFGLPIKLSTAGTNPFVKECAPITNKSKEGESKGKFRCKVEDVEITDKLLKSKLFLIPVTTGGDFGSASEIFVPDPKDGEAACVGPVDPENESGHLQDMIFGDEAACDEKVGLWDPMYNFDIDSDGDGLKDIVEMMLRIRNGHVYIAEYASCGLSSAVTKWTQTDSDEGGGDGIEDQNELHCADVLVNGVMQPGGAVKDSQSQVLDYMLCGKTGVKENVQGEIWYDFGPIAEILRDTDGDGKVDARDDDSDGDGKKDWQEDRAKMFKGGRDRKAFLMKVTETVNDMRFMPFGERIICYDPSDEALKQKAESVYKFNPDKGVSYGIYIINKTAQEVQPLSMASNLSEETDYDIVALKCMSSGLDDGYSFNGEYDGGDCSDARDENDTDCGYGSANGNKCFPGEMLQVIEDPNGEYLNEDRTAMVPSEEDPAIPKLFMEVLNGTISPEELRTRCGDFDDDGIPNCVELVVGLNTFINLGSCPDDYIYPNGAVPAAGTIVPLNPYNIDSDLDGSDDGWNTQNPDKCPMMAATADDGVNLNAEATETLISCSNQAYQLFVTHEILAFYVDRDGDTIRDIYEYFDDKSYLSGLSSDLASFKSQLAVARNMIDKKPAVVPGFVTPTDPLRADSEYDGLDDWTEVAVLMTMPGYNDTDNDSLPDYDEVSRDGNEKSSSATVVSDDSCNSVKYDTDPTKPDTDLDGLSDYEEVMITKTSPNDIDSDNDGLCDGVIVVGNCTGAYGELVDNIPTDPAWNSQTDIVWYQSNPCSSNTDNPTGDPNGDIWSDGQEPFGCANNPDPKCEEIDPALFGTGAGDIDSDSDGIPDKYEPMAGAVVGEWDTDKDGLPDGCVDGLGELCMSKKDGWKSLGSGGSIYFNSGTAPFFEDSDTDPNNPDCDYDGLSDLIERKYPTDPWNPDTDGDCLFDGIEDKNANGKWDSNETKAASDLSVVGDIEDMFEAIDTDGDGIPDGNHPAYSQWGCEDCNCNGEQDFDANGVPLELNPLSWDSDGDGIDDWTEMSAGGFYNPANLSSALSGRRGGCSMVPGTTMDTNIIVIFGGLMMLVAVIRRRAKAASKK